MRMRMRMIMRREQSVRSQDCEKREERREKREERRQK